MNLTRHFSIWALAFGALLATTGAHAQESAIRKNLAARVPQLQNIDEVRKSPMPGLYEVRTGTDIFYTDAKGDYVLHGEMLDTRERKNLTEERVNKITAIDFDDLPARDAFKIVRGKGERKLAVFEDPNCGYCKRFEKELQTIDNVTVYMYLYPILGADSVDKSNRLWCAKDQGRAWQDHMLDEKPITAAAGCDTGAVSRNVAFGRKLKITGTPTLIFADGTRVPGAIDAKQIEQRLAAAR